MKNNSLGKVVIAEGKNQADYIISLLKTTKKPLVVINSDRSFGKQLSLNHGVSVFVGRPYQTYVLDSANIRDADIFIALDKVDVNNFVMCKLAKDFYGVKKCICTVSDPTNVTLFRELGIDSVVCSTYLLGEVIQNETNVEDVMKTLSIEQGKISIVEIKIEKGDYSANKPIMEVGFPSAINISCIYRSPKVIIPNGRTIIKEGDKLTIVCESENAAKVRDYIKKGLSN